jgi:hypothetical protein
MTALTSPSFALPSARSDSRRKQFSLGRPRAVLHSPAAITASGGMAPDSVFKRLPAIGDTAAVEKQRS